MHVVLKKHQDPELPENLDKMFPWYYMHSDVFNRSKFLTNYPYPKYIFPKATI